MKYRASGAEALAVLVLLAACGRGAADAKVETGAVADTAAVTLAFTAAQIEHGGVEWRAAVSSAVATTLELPGELVPDDDHTARLGAPVGGRVMSVQVRLGDRVSEGQPLVTLQSPDASAARADHEKALADLAANTATATFTSAERQRHERLLVIKAGSRQELEQAASADAGAQAAVRHAESEVARTLATMRQLGVSIDAASGTMVLRSPISGVVLRREAEPGTVAMAGAPLVTVSDPRTLWLEVAASDRAVSDVRVGARVRFTVPALVRDTFEARVQSVGSALDETTRTVPVRVVVANATGKLRVGMFATVWIDGTGTRDAVLVPSAAVQQLDNQPVVFIATPDGKGGASFEHRPVRTGSIVGSQIQLLDGVRAGDQIVFAGAFAVKSEFARAKMARE